MTDTREGVSGEARTVGRPDPVGSQPRAGGAPEPLARTFPVIEVFGPTIQGEGFLAGLPTHFVRFGLCDYRCEWCDSMYAVEPEQVNANAEKLTAEQIAERVWDLTELAGSAPVWVTLSGGNPAIHDLGPLVAQLHDAGFKVTVETQGSIWRDWLTEIDHLTVSPKPPSAKMDSPRHREQFAEFMARLHIDVAYPEALASLKIVVFDQADLDWARDVIGAFATLPSFLSVGTQPVGRWGSEVVAAESHSTAVRKIGERYGWLCEQAARDPVFVNTRVLPQLHVVAWGHARGV